MLNLNISQLARRCAASVRPRNTSRTRAWIFPKETHPACETGVFDTGVRVQRLIGLIGPQTANAGAKLTLDEPRPIGRAIVSTCSDGRVQPVGFLFLMCIQLASAFRTISSGSAMNLALASSSKNR